MRREKCISIRATVRKTGRVFVNNLTDMLPFELHIPGYIFCGTSTQLKKRLLRGDSG